MPPCLHMQLQADRSCMVRVLDACVDKENLREYQQGPCTGLRLEQLDSKWLL